MELTEGQRRVVDHGHGVMQVVGAAGTGKTTALTARYLRLVREHRPSSVVVLCRSRGAAVRFRDAVLPGLAGGFDSLPVTTVVGLAFDVVTRSDGPLRLVTGPEQRRTVARLLGDEDRSAWPTLGHLLGRRALVDEVADALLLLQHRPAAAALDADPAWDELRRFLPRYRQALAGLGGLDVAGLLGRAADLLGDGAGGGGTADRFGHVLVDDCEAAGPASERILHALAAAATDLVVAGDCHGVDPVTGVDLGDVSFRRPAPPVLVTCRHPSLEAEAIAAELLAARHRGVEWSDMAVLLRHPARRIRRLSRALARHGVPAAVATPAIARDDPVVASVVDMLRWVDGDAAALDRLLVSPLSGLDPLEARRIRRKAHAEDTPLEADPRLIPLVGLRDRLAARATVDPPAELAFAIWGEGLAHLVADDGADGRGEPLETDSLDALVGFLDALNRDAERNPDARLGDVLAAVDLAAGSEIDPYRVSAATPADAVTVTSIVGAAGREWHTVVLAGCVEGELPSIRAREPLFDAAVLDGTERPSSAERRRQALSEERRLFALAGSRAKERLVGVAAPEPGVLLSRFVEAWPAVPAGVVLPPADAPPPLSPTRNRIPVVSGTGLTLSATQLDTYDDCPLRYAYRYVVRVRDEGGVRADLGSLVHDVLRRFLDPSGDVPRTRDALVDLGRGLWRDDIARYRPQVEEARRDYFAMLENWWQAEGEGPMAPEVLAVEHPFDIEVAGHRLRGAIDRVDRADDGHGIRILDYKTGKSEPTRAQAADTNLQLAVYHLAATRDPALASLGPPTQLRLLFLRTMRCYDQDVLAGMAEATEARIADVAGRIRGEEFQPAVDANCRWCSFQRLCPIQPEGRQIGDRQLGDLQLGDVAGGVGA